MRRTGSRRLAACALASILLLGACIGDTNTPDDPEETSAAESAGPPVEGDESTPPLAEVGESVAQELPSDPADDDAYADFYDQGIDWGECAEDVTEQSQDDLECATVTVPLAWDTPDGEDIEISLVKLPATGESEGSLLTNPGGPGGSGVDFVGRSGSTLFSQELRESYDLIGFDPRGVSRSAGIECLDDAQTDEYRADTYDAATEEGLDATLEWTDRISEACASNSGDVLPYLDTYSVARDLDVLRATLGDEELDYLGFSYGTYLGATYADLYPERTGHIILDGALDPQLTADQISEGQAEGFDQALDAFAQYCLDQEECALRGPSAEEATEQPSDLLDSIAEDPLPTNDSDRPLTGALASSAVLMLLYNDANWSFGIEALNAAANGDGSQLLYYGDLSSDRMDDGSYLGNSNYAITAVNCLDRVGVEDVDWQREQTERLQEEYPHLGMTMYNQATCDRWPESPVREPAPIAAEGSSPIVVIGTTGDPATPYAWSENLAEQLDDSRLLTFEADGHTAYGRSGGCIEEAVDAYLLEDTVPEDGLVCSG